MGLTHCRVGFGCLWFGLDDGERGGYFGQHVLLDSMHVFHCTALLNLGCLESCDEVILGLISFAESLDFIPLLVDGVFLIG